MGRIAHFEGCSKCAMWKGGECGKSISHSQDVGRIVDGTSSEVLWVLLSAGKVRQTDGVEHVREEHDQHECMLG